MGEQEQRLALSVAERGTAFGVVYYIPSIPLDLQQHW